uniref:Uncharacterized protein n=1 Tax=Sander lucioperca TaxID=283035 RepID=A0A8C9YNU0_SANLU
MAKTNDREGFVFEASYSAAINDSTRRRYTIANAVCLMETCKGKVFINNNIILSECPQPLELRGPYGITNLGLLFGFWTIENEFVSETYLILWCLLLSETGKTASGIIYTVKSCSDSPPADCKPRLHHLRQNSSWLMSDTCSSCASVFLPEQVKLPQPREPSLG